MPTGRAEERVKDVLAAMRRGAGDSDALDKLKEHSGKEGAASDTEKPAPEVEGLKIEGTTVIRPNGETYHVRKIDKHHDVAMLRQARTEGIYPLLTGPPGTGKTALIEAAYAEGDTIYTVQGSGDTEVSDFIGGYVQVIDPVSHEVRYVLVKGPLIRAAEEGRVLYVDEIVLVDPKVLAILYAFMDGRKEMQITQFPELDPVQIKDGFFVASAANPNAPGARMSEALLSRFLLQFEVTTDYVLAKRLGVNATMITAAQNMQKKVDNGGVMSWAPQLRELLAFKKISDAFGEEVALRNMVMQAPEMDRSQCADVISRVFHKSYKGLRLS